MEEEPCKVRSICPMLHQELGGQSRGMPAWCWGGVATQGRPQGPWQCLCPSRWGLSNLCVVVMEPGWMLDDQSHPFLAHVSLPLLPNLSGWQYLSCLSLPMAVGGEAGTFPLLWGPSMPSSTTLAGDGRRAVGCGWDIEQDACEALGSLRSAARALPLHPTSLELELGAVPTLAGCSAPTSQIF